MQLPIQALGVGVSALLAFVGTFVILKILDYTIGIRAKEEEEDLGLDISYHQEVAYENK
jgi:ammonium transporter, Amt family